MVEICNYLSVVSSQEASNLEDGFVVEKCSDYDPAIDLSIVCWYANIEKVKSWIMQNCKKIAKYACEQIDSGQGALAMKLVASTLKIQSYTRELVAATGGVQQFLDAYHKTSDLNMSNDTETIINKPAEQPVWRDDDDDEPNFFGGAASVSEPEQESVSESNETMSVDTSDFDDEVNITPSIKESGYLAIPEPEDVDVHQSNVSDLVSNSIAITIPANLAGGSEVKVPFNSLVDFANYINEAADKLETSEFADSYLLQKDSIPYAIEYVDKFSPTMLKEFIKDYVQSAVSDTDFIRVTKLLDSLVAFSENYGKAGEDDE